MLPDLTQVASELTDRRLLRLPHRRADLLGLLQDGSCGGHCELTILLGLLHGAVMSAFRRVLLGLLQDASCNAHCELLVLLGLLQDGAIS